jgi:voltage-gated potassium channel
VMSTLGFGDITFTSDIGRVFSIVVLLSGIVLLLIVLPFTFIRFFYAPWLEARLRLRAPRRTPEGTAGHVIICAQDSITPGLVERLKVLRIPHFVIEPDAASAARLVADGIPVVAGEPESRATYEALLAQHARLVLANSSDTINTNITLTVREVAPAVPIAAIVTQEDSVDILELSGCNHVLPLKQRLGEQLANRVDAGHPQAHEIGSIRGLQIAEFPARHTPLAGRTIRDTRLRAETGTSIVAVWEHGRLHPADPDLRLSDLSVPVVIGSAAEISALNSFLVPYGRNDHPVLIIGGGTVGTAAAQALKRKGIPVHLIERDPAGQARLLSVADRLFVGDAADREVLMAAGVDEAPSVLLSTNDDAMNIYLAIYCRRLNPQLRIVCRITHERNIEAIHRAGADFVLTYASLGIQTVASIVQGRELIMLGEGVDLFTVPVPRSLVGLTLAETGIGARTGLTVIAVQLGSDFTGSPPPSTKLLEGCELLLLGGSDRRRRFSEVFA